MHTHIHKVRNIYQKSFKCYIKYKNKKKKNNVKI